MSDSALRPLLWDHYIGQRRLKAELQIQIKAAAIEDRLIRHTLLAAPPGVGKTTLAQLIAEEYGCDFTRLVMPLTPKTLARALQDCIGVLLLDELHRAKPSEQEMLLTVIEDNYFQLSNGRRLAVEGLTIIGATTEPQKIITPLWDRFEAAGGVPAFDPYTDEEMALIVLGMAQLREVELSDEAALVYGAAAAATPRVAAKFVNRHAELGLTLGRTPTAEETLESLRMNIDGLNPRHIRYLEVLDALGGTKGVATISKLMRVPASVIEELEILLVTRDYIDFTHSGREITPKGRAAIRRSGDQHERLCA